MHQYSSDISREEHTLIQKDLEGAKKRTQPRKYDLNDVFCAVLYVIQGGYRGECYQMITLQWQSVY